MGYSLLIGIHDLDQGGVGKDNMMKYMFREIWLSIILERERRLSGVDMNTSDLSGNDSSDGSGNAMLLFS